MKQFGYNSIYFNLPDIDENPINLAGLAVTISPSFQVPTKPTLISGYRYTHPSPSAFEKLSHNLLIIKFKKFKFKKLYHHSQIIHLSILVWCTEDTASPNIKPPGINIWVGNIISDNYQFIQIAGYFYKFYRALICHKLNPSYC